MQNNYEQKRADRCIEEMAIVIHHGIKMGDAPMTIASDLYKANYRRVYEDTARQCACYSLGCLLAETLEKRVASEFIAAVDEMMEAVTAMTGVSLTYYGRYAELKHKYLPEEESSFETTEKDTSIAESIIRCRDCKHGQQVGELGVLCEYGLEEYRPFDHFCGWAERRTFENEDNEEH